MLGGPFAKLGMAITKASTRTIEKDHTSPMNTNDQRMVQESIESGNGCRFHQLKHAIRRDLAFLFLGILAAGIVSYVETNAWDESSRWNPGGIMSNSEANVNFDTVSVHVPVTHNDQYFDSNDANDALVGTFHISEQTLQCTRSAAVMPSIAIATTPNNGRIIDAGFVLTNPLHHYLARKRHVNDILAMINSLCLIVPFLYVVYVTVWNGDFTLSFRLIWVHLFRSLCGWFTYLPPDPEFLPSRYDFPEVVFCLFRDCSEITNFQQSSSNAVPFVTFFSGHIASIVIIANHLYVQKNSNDGCIIANGINNAKVTKIKSLDNTNKLLSTSLHAFNWLQIQRLLATRGHYSIDLIVGYVVAVFVSSFAERFGWCYSHGVRPRLPTGMLEVWEVLIGVGPVDLNGNEYDFDECCRNGSEKARRFEAEETNRPIGDCSNENRSMSMDDDILNTRVRSKTSLRMAIDIFSEYSFKREFFLSENGESKRENNI